MIPPRSLLPLAALTLSACVAVPPPQPPTAPLVAYPGAGKTPEALQADDAACRAQAAGTPLTNLPATSATPGNAAGGPGTSPPPAPPSPEEAYLQCMAARGNVVAPAYTPPTLSYAPVYPAYFYGAYSWGYPWGYPSPFFGFGYHRFYGGYRGFYGGYRGFYGGYRGFYGRPLSPHGGFRGAPFSGGRGRFSHRGRH